MYIIYIFQPFTLALENYVLISIYNVVFSNQPSWHTWKQGFCSGRHAKICIAATPHESVGVCYSGLWIPFPRTVRVRIQEGSNQYAI